MKCIEDEIPFELPQGWEWCRLSNIALILNGDRGQNYPAKNKLQTEGIPFVSSSNIDNGSVSSKELLCLTENQYNALGAGKLKKATSYIVSVVHWASVDKRYYHIFTVKGKCSDFKENKN